VRYYFKNLIFHVFDFVSSLINCLLSFIGIYPKLDFGISYLCAIEVKKMQKDLGHHMENKAEKLEQADNLKAEAERALDVGS